MGPGQVLKKIILWKPYDFYSLLSEGTVPVPPNRPCALGLLCITLSGVIPQGDATAAGAKAFHAVAPKSVEIRKIRIILSDRPQKNSSTPRIPGRRGPRISRGCCCSPVSPRGLPALDRVPVPRYHRAHAHRQNTGGGRSR